MKINARLLQFPAYLPNDEQGFMFYYPEKFPPIVKYYEEVAQKIASDPKGYEEYGYWARDELWEGFYKIKADYEKGDQSDLAFLVKTDERLGKLFCYRFWVVNYLFADGPLHDYFVDNLKNLIRKFIDVEDEVEQFEAKVVSIQRDLLQSDYADLYLQQALSGVKLMKLLKEHAKTKALLAQVTPLIDAHNHQQVTAVNTIHQLWDEVVRVIQDERDPKTAALRQELEVPLGQVEMRKTMLPVYNMLTHTVEFRDENESLATRHGHMTNKMDGYRDIAKQKLTADDFELFELSYKQARNFGMFKDIIGNIDGDLLPLWFGLHSQAKEILAKTTTIKPRSTGHSAVAHYLVWHLPDELKAKVMTPDLTPFILETI